MMSKPRETTMQDMERVAPMGIADGLAAVKYVRSNANHYHYHYHYHVNPSRIGFMGFSTGGTVAAGVAFTKDPAARADFVAPIYAGLQAITDRPVPADAPPLFLVAASNDQAAAAPYACSAAGQFQSDPAGPIDWLGAAVIAPTSPTHMQDGATAFSCDVRTTLVQPVGAVNLDLTLLA